MNNFNDDLLKKASGKIGMTPEQLSNAAKQNNISEILKHLDKNDAEKIQNVLNNKAATKDLLNSPQAKAILENLFKK